MAIKSSKYRGVSLHTKRNTGVNRKEERVIAYVRKYWKASIFFGGKTHILGYFKDEIPAALAYNRMAKKHHEEPKLNII